MSGETDSVQSGLRYLLSSQREDGGFWSETIEGRKTRQRRSPFPTALILQALETLDPDPSAQAIATRALDYLRRQRADTGGHNYWERGSIDSQIQPYPDDLDDTACTYQAELAWAGSQLEGSVAGKLTRLLLETESQPGGPYSTWICPPDSRWKDIDPAVNANIALLLKTAGVSMPTLDAYLRTYFEKHLESPYYVGTAPPLYFLARYVGRDLWSSAERARLASRIRKEAMGHGLIHQAMAASARLALGICQSFETSTVQALITAQKPDGSWLSEAIIIEHSPSATAGSPALSTALALETLLRYHQHQSPPKHPAIPAKDRGADKTSAPAEEVLTLFNTWNATLPAVLHKSGTTYLDKITRSTHLQEIALLPNLWQSHLREHATLPKKLSATLGMANLLGWIAYTILDDAYDESMVDALPYALACTRELDRIYTSILPHTSMSSLFQRTMNSLDAANAWELRNARLEVTHTAQGTSITLGSHNLPTWKNLQVLASRSMGHALGPLALLLQLGYEENSDVYLAAFKFFEHTLIARQLNDDLHDWEEDLQAGRLTYPVTLLIQPLSEEINTLAIDDATIQRLRLRYYGDILPLGCRTLQNHVHRARKHLACLSEVMTDTTSIDTLLLCPHENAAKAALTGQDATRQFLDGLYHQERP